MGLKLMEGKKFLLSLVAFLYIFYCGWIKFFFIVNFYTEMLKEEIIQNLVTDLPSYPLRNN